MRKLLLPFLAFASLAANGAPTVAQPTQSLDGQWQSAYDSSNRGLSEKWYDLATFPAKEAKPALVPGSVTETWPAVGWWQEEPDHVYWYVRSFEPKFMSQPHMRYYLRFGAVRESSDVWLNGVSLGHHQGGEDPFEYDVTKDLQPGKPNTVAVRLASTFLGGIWQHVSLVAQPEVRIIDAFARPDAEAGQIKLDVTVENDTTDPARVRIHAAVGEFKPARPLDREGTTLNAPPGQSVTTLVLPVAHPHLWDLNDPFLYTIEVTSDWKPVAGPTLRDSDSFRSGFRDFRIVNGYFELNGRRIFLKSCHGNYYDPVSLQGTLRDMSRINKDFPQLKKAGFNMMRIIVAAAMPEQLDQADELGLLIFSEHETSWLCRHHDQFGDTLDQCARRDRNHPSLVMWGLLNENDNQDLYQRAVAALPGLRAVDDTRVVLLSSGRWDGNYKTGSASNPGSSTFNVYLAGEDPVHPRSAGNVVGAYANRGAGDLHDYPQYPMPWDFFTEFSQLCHDTHPFFLSECGIGSTFNFFQEKRELEAVHAPPVCMSWEWVNPPIGAIEKTWDAAGLKETYPKPEDMLIDSGLEAAKQRALLFSLVRGQPKVNGYSLTSLEDFWGAGEGVMDNFRVFKPGHLAVLQAGWAPLRWCLLVNPTNAYADRPIHFRASLANEDVLAPGDYPATLSLSGPGGVVWKKAVSAHFVKDGPFASVVFDEDVSIPNLQPGDYTLSASLDGHANAAASDATFLVASRSSLPRISGAVTLASVQPNIRALLTSQGATLHDYAPGESIPHETILVGREFKTDAAGWRALYARAARGAHIVFLAPEAFGAPKEDLKWLALPMKGRFNRTGDWLYHKDVVGKVNEPLLAGLQTRLMTPEYYGPLLDDTGYFENMITPAETAAVAIWGNLEDRYRFHSGSMLGVYPFHSGHLTVNGFNVVSAIGTPAADRLLLNIVAQAQADAAPVSPLPAGFDAELNQLGIR